ncbi:CvpA family protein [Polynucleobacter sp. IMCC 30228]|uniref:CvpA family protein n=1 Tax=Polynucleobacter sp. IMCC 30228 TaxID=2781011 RepID=UPI001F23E4AE|nr:CvpA family protein [Polynucleobacter sp. IMCC 30228]MCE7527223.1 CvpA family protein [Polynucleobacter sp. IMCC 30228]
MELLASLKLTPVDYVVFTVLLISALVGVSRGLFKEVLALFSWIIAAWIAYHYSEYLSTEWLSTFKMDELFRLGLSFLILFVAALIACGLLGGIIQKLILSAGLSLTDRFLGLIFGLLRGVVVVVILASLAALTPLTQSTDWRLAKTRTSLEIATSLIKTWLPADWASQLGALPKGAIPNLALPLKLGS